MKYSFLLFVFFCVYTVYSQEVYLFDFNETVISNPVNVSNNPGVYDNQPSFLDNNTLLFSSTRNRQTDILWYDIDSGSKKWISDTRQGSEYSPLKIPGLDALSSIRLDTTGYQRLYQYDYSGNSRVLIEDLVIGYHVWASENLIVSFVLGEESSLVATNVQDQSSKTFDKSIGRSLHRIPGSDLISYISKSGEQWEIKSLHPVSGEKKSIIRTPDGSEDMCWTPSGTILMGKGNTIYKFTPGSDQDWIPMKTFDMDGITRLTMSPDGQKLAVVFSE